MKEQIEEHTKLMVRNFCSRLLDAAQLDPNPDKAFQDYLAIFARKVAKEIANLDKSYERCADLDIFLMKKGLEQATEDANKHISEVMRRRNECWII